ncbi:hypothetical protein D9M70_447290 [compost metagenome]
MQQVGDGFALADDFAGDIAVAGGALVGNGFAPCHLQRQDLGLEPGGADRRLDHHGEPLQLGLRGGIEGAHGKRIERERAPWLPLDLQAGAHAVVHRQRLAHALVDQAVVRVGQHAVVVEAGHAAPRQDRRQARMQADGEAPAQRVADQAVHCHRAQVVFLQPQQRHGAAAEMRPQAADQALQAHGVGQVGHKVGQQLGNDRGSHHGEKHQLG